MDFFKSAIEVNEKLKTQKFEPVLFPKTEIGDNGDEHFTRVWNLIDSSKDFVCFSMYHFDDTFAANLT